MTTEKDPGSLHGFDIREVIEPLDELHHTAVDHMSNFTVFRAGFKLEGYPDQPPLISAAILNPVHDHVRGVAGFAVSIAALDGRRLVLGVSPDVDDIPHKVVVSEPVHAAEPLADALATSEDLTLTGNGLYRYVTKFSLLIQKLTQSSIHHPQQNSHSRAEPDFIQSFPGFSLAPDIANLNDEIHGLGATTGTTTHSAVLLEGGDSIDRIQVVHATPMDTVHEPGADLSEYIDDSVPQAIAQIRRGETTHTLTVPRTPGEAKPTWRSNTPPSDDQNIDGELTARLVEALTQGDLEVAPPFAAAQTRSTAMLIAARS